MPTIHASWEEILLWNLLAYVVSFIPHSFVEWLSHRFVLHSKAIVSFAYEEHDQQHHQQHRGDETFIAPSLLDGPDFRPRDWALFISVVMPIWVGIEFLAGKPVVIGAFLSVVSWLWMFDVLHRRYHFPRGSWIERTGFFKYLREHHRLHHVDPTRNMNVCFYPIADFVLRTMKRSD